MRTKCFISSFWLSIVKAEEKESCNKMLYVNAEAEVGGLHLSFMYVDLKEW